MIETGLAYLLGALTAIAFLVVDDLIDRGRRAGIVRRGDERLAKESHAKR